MKVTVTTSGALSVETRLDQFPKRLHDKLRDKFIPLTRQIQARAQSRAPYGVSPYRKGPHLRSEVESRVFADRPDRVAGYVEIWAPGQPKEYPKAATMEYGTHKARKIRERIAGSKRRIVKRVSRVVDIPAFQYLRGGLADMKSQVEATINETIGEAVTEENSSG
jgi:hypothetical protein